MIYSKRLNYITTLLAVVFFQSEVIADQNPILIRSQAETIVNSIPPTNQPTGGYDIRYYATRLHDDQFGLLVRNELLDVLKTFDGSILSAVRILAILEGSKLVPELSDKHAHKDVLKTNIMLARFIHCDNKVYFSRTEDRSSPWYSATLSEGGTTLKADGRNAQISIMHQISDRVIPVRLSDFRFPMKSLPPDILTGAVVEERGDATLLSKDGIFELELRKDHHLVARVSEFDEVNARSYEIFQLGNCAVVDSGLEFPVLFLRVAYDGAADSEKVSKIVGAAISSVKKIDKFPTDVVLTTFPERSTTIVDVRGEEEQVYSVQGPAQVIDVNTPLKPVSNNVVSSQLKRSDTSLMWTLIISNVAVLALIVIALIVYKIYNRKKEQIQS